MEDIEKILEEYKITKTKTDLKSSLRSLNEELINDYIDCNYKFSNDNLNMEDKINITYDLVINRVKNLFDLIKKTETSKVKFTKEYFNKLLTNENKNYKVLTSDIIEEFWVFIYYNDGYSYYIPDEIKDIIKKK